MIVVAAPRLLTTAQAARELGISTRTLVRYAERGYITPAETLPSKHRRWDVEQVRRQMREINSRDED